MSLSRRECVIASTISREEASATSPHLSLPTNVYDELKVKVWEERPLSPYTYAQLYWGEIAIGARILVHRQKLFADASEAIDKPQTNSIFHFEQAKKWLKLCSENHTLCNSKNGITQELPARLLRPEYLAFSHCWGASEVMRFKLLASNIERCYEGIDFMRLSQNMQDAITTTLSLGSFSYLWIDSLCIIQQDEKYVAGDETWKRDWEAEAKKMGSVYSGAALTIASTGSSSSDGGCFHARNTQSLKPVKIGVSSCTSPDTDWIYARRDDVFDFERNVNLAPLNTRGWVMQERLLSRRILHFGAEMIYWECCGRSASELNPHGYTYKAYPEDFGDWYMPQIPGRMEDRRDVERAEREGRGFSWANSEAVRRRPPPVMTDPDNEAAALSTQAGVWQRRRGFWKDVLKRDDESWSRDEKGGEKGDEKERRVRGGFRATFEALRSKQLHDTNPYAWPMQNGAGVEKKDILKKTELLVGRHSFSQMWYDIVESYSRGKLTVPADKIIALKGIQDEVAYATGFNYMYGLWRESLVADLLWFAIEGPGQRLRNGLGAPVAPTWSSDIRTAVDATQRGEARIELRGWTFPMSHFSRGTDTEADVWGIGLGNAKTISAKVFFDTSSPDILLESSFTCMPFLVLKREKVGAFVGSYSKDIQGLVLRLVKMSDSRGNLDIYERVGYFATSYMPTSQGFSTVQAALGAQEAKTICLTG
ncbi:hypothetical protein EKO27_g4046 [Xylaria grammica]|uniref:Heterokaryon incompatibility domain-containing protein n=1 Tax=Xylaria grammica TaxID=363999 RepID=A0A439D9G2_9PEZI|nr:hypothetical protein EKO27_g4046 [Xylaria grammica]